MGPTETCCLRISHHHEHCRRRHAFAALYRLCHHKKTKPMRQTKITRAKQACGAYLAAVSTPTFPLSGGNVQRFHGEHSTPALPLSGGSVQRFQGCLLKVQRFPRNNVQQRRRVIPCERRALQNQISCQSDGDHYLKHAGARKRVTPRGTRTAFRFTRYTLRFSRRTLCTPLTRFPKATPTRRPVSARRDRCT